MNDDWFEFAIYTLGTVCGALLILQAFLDESSTAMLVGSMIFTFDAWLAVSKWKKIRSTRTP